MTDMSDRMSILISQLGSWDNIVLMLALYTAGLALVWYELESLPVFASHRRLVVKGFWYYVVFSYLALFAGLTIFWPGG
jgi:hypothetical protein